MLYILRFLILIIFFTPHQVWAEALPMELTKSLNNMASMEGFSCEFDQVLMFSDGSEQAYQGSLMIHRPNRFRWQYRMPYEQLFVSDGQSIWHYEPDLMQVRQLNNMRDVDPAVMQLLAGKIDINDIQLLQKQPELKRYHIQLKNNTKIWLGLNEKMLVEYAESSDVLNNRNRIHFRNINATIPNDKNFVFHVPDGVELLSNHK